MSRSIRFVLAGLLIVVGSSLARSQDTPPPTSADASAPAGPSVSSLKAENTALKKEVNDAAKTIAQLQAQVAQDKTQLDAANASLASANAALAAAKAQPAPITAADTSTSVPPAPAGPLKALPLDATNVVSTPGAPGTAADAGPTKTYTVVKGDSLWKIAHKMYPHDTKNGVDKIQDANKDAIGGKPLKIGQVLVIPQ